MNEFDILELFDLYCHDELYKLGASWPECSSLTISLLDVQKYSVDLYNELIEQPEKAIAELETHLERYEFPFDIPDDFKPTVRITGLNENIRIRDIRSADTDKLLSISGLVQKISIVYPQVLNAVFECQLCGEKVDVLQNPQGVFISPQICENEMCGRKGPFKLLMQESYFVDAQKMRLQESPEDLHGSEQPQTFDVYVTGDITGTIQPGNRVTITGILKSFQQNHKQIGKTARFDLIFDGRHIKPNNSEMDIEITLEDEEKIKQIADGEPINWLVDNFAPIIYGYQIIKEALLASAVSGENEIGSDGTIKRGYSHLLICGDPATAKSTLLNNLKSLIPRSQYTTGDGASKAGLTAAVVKDDFSQASFSVEAGALVLADKSVAIIDELDKIRKQDIAKLNTVLYRSEVPINKAGINTTLWARCPVICAMNPTSGRFDPFDNNIVGQISVPDATLTRFDLVFVMRDIPDEIVDEQVSDVLVDAWCGDGLPTNGDLLRKYIATAKQIKTVTLTQDAQQGIKDYYRGLRREYDRIDGTVPITSRNLEALIRLTRSEAKLRLSSSAEIRDVQRAIKLIEASRQDVCIDESGRYDVDMIEVGSSKSQRDKIKIIKDIIVKLQKNNNGKYADVALCASEVGLSVKELDLYIKKMKQQGILFEPKSGYLRVS